jgi:hypothetical protein
MFNHFYKKSIRKTVIAFGSLFNNIRVVRNNADGTEKEQIRLPLAYGPKEKFLRRIRETSSISDDNKVIEVPRLSFEITNYIYDPSRKRNSLTKRRAIQTIPDKYEYTYAEVPYDISFSLQSYVRYMDDALQITEQILPYFAPDFTVTVNYSDINEKVDVPISLNDVSISEEYEGSFDTRRLITTQYTFTAKSYVFGPTKKTESEVIRSADIAFFDLEGSNFLTKRQGGSGPTGAVARSIYGVSGANETIHTFDYTTDVSTDRFVGGATGSDGIDILGNTYA